MNANGSEPVTKGWRRLFPLIVRARVSKWITGKADWLADWITPESRPLTEPTTTNPETGADSAHQSGD